MKISVIIPVYNVEKYLRECLESVINQSFKNLEIICVNDCSRDSSLEILKEYEKKDSRIKILNNEETLGRGRARNAALKEASGDYIHFLDSDDWLEQNAYEKMAEYLKKVPELEILHFSYNQFNFETEISISKKYKNKDLVYKIVNFEDNPNMLQNWQRSIWTRLYSREFIEKNNLYFKNYRQAEDIEYSVRVLLAAKSVYFVPDCLINYRYHRKGSATDRFIQKCRKDAIEQFFEIKEYASKLYWPQRHILMLWEAETFIYTLREGYYRGYFNYFYTYETARRAELWYIDELKKLEWATFYLSIVKMDKASFELKYAIRNYIKSRFILLFRILINLKKKMFRK